MNHLDMSDSEEELLLFSSAVKWYIGSLRRKYCVHSINTNRYEFGEFHYLYNEENI